MTNKITDIELGSDKIKKTKLRPAPKKKICYSLANLREQKFVLTRVKKKAKQEIGMNHRLSRFSTSKTIPGNMNHRSKLQEVFTAVNS